MTLFTTIEVDEIDTPVEVQFEAYNFGGIDIVSITDDLGNAVEINYHQEMILIDTCHEFVASI